MIGDVEDASDSEQEDLSSNIWRNRKPSEGGWMEPVQGCEMLTGEKGWSRFDEYDM